MSKFYSLDSLLGNTWAYYYIVIGARGIGKTFSAQEYCIRQWKKNKRPFYWLRLTTISRDKLLLNNAQKLIDPLLLRRYNLDLTVRGTTVYNHDEPFCEVLAISEGAKEKGVAMYDKDDTRMVNICCDEFIREPNERVTFDISYNLAMVLENLRLGRHHSNFRIIMMCNLLSQANEICSAFNFIPLKLGRYKLKKKKVVMDYVANSADYMEEVARTPQGILLGDQSNYTNVIEQDLTLILPRNYRPYSPTAIIKFDKEPRTWFTLWDGNCILPYNKEKGVIWAMRPFIDTSYDKKLVNKIYQVFHSRLYNYRDLTTMLQFQNQLKLLKPNG
jgi:Podovirus DNA encapsidation protein (Gp16).